MSVEIPKVTIAIGPYGIPQGDVIDLKVHLGCTNEVSSFELLLQNWDKKYSPNGSYPINVGMDGNISIGRSTNVPQIITCRVEAIKYESTPTENYLRVSGRCWGERLFRRVVTKTYENKKGEEIVKDLLDYYVGLSHVRDSTELVENTDTTYTRLEYQDTPVFDIFKYIAGSADKQGLIGFDFRVAPDAKFEFFPRNSKTSPVSLSEKIEVSEYRKDIHSIRNKITVYGTQDKPFPVDVDGRPWSDTLTEDLTVSEGTGWGGSDELIHAVYGKWTVMTGSTNLALDTAIKYAGAKSVKVIESAYMYYTRVDWIFNQGYLINLNEFPKISFALMIDEKHSKLCWINAIDYWNNSASKSFELTKINAWEKVIINAGTKNADQWDWIDTLFNWAFVKEIGIAVDQNYASAGNWWIDQFHFGYGKWKSTQEDTASQTTYGLRELVEVDEELYSDNACMLRAKALLNQLKNPAEYLTVKSTVIDYGNTPLLPGDKIHITIPNENIDSDFRILSVEYHVDAKTQ
ncbi:MAG: hypothetical protein K6T73_06180, partial [Candidatus Bathyarchaeota archaeon]|nr:hypothetical protein [Candidatus Bathyarchaeota archaeon]